MQNNHKLAMTGRIAPTVEIDTEASAAYVRFTRAKVAKTVRHGSGWPIITIDLDTRGQVVGIEFVGIRKFNLEHLLKRVSLKAPARTIARANYISSEAHEVAA
jgi:uncharacterized protein YuzE